MIGTPDWGLDAKKSRVLCWQTAIMLRSNIRVGRQESPPQGGVISGRKSREQGAMQANCYKKSRVLCRQTAIMMRSNIRVGRQESPPQGGVVSGRNHRS